MARGTFDRVVRERPFGHTHFTDEETEALRDVVTCPHVFRSHFRCQVHLFVAASPPWF